MDLDYLATNCKWCPYFSTTPEFSGIFPFSNTQLHSSIFCYITLNKESKTWSTFGTQQSCGRKRWSDPLGTQRIGGAINIRYSTDKDVIDIWYSTSVLRAEALVGSTWYSRSWARNPCMILNRRRRNRYSRNCLRRHRYLILNKLARGVSGSAYQIHSVLNDGWRRDQLLHRELTPRRWSNSSIIRILQIN